MADWTVPVGLRGEEKGLRTFFIIDWKYGQEFVRYNEENSYGIIKHQQELGEVVIDSCTHGAFSDYFYLFSYTLGRIWML